MASSLSSTNTDFEYFGQNVYSTVCQSNYNQNVFLSPASIALAMAMCTVGARRETLNQMLHVFNASSIEHLAKIAEKVMYIFSVADYDTQVQLKLVNRLYAQKSYTLRQDYLNFVQSFFKADITLEDFENNSAYAIQTINAWIEEQTYGLIQNLLSINDASQYTRLIIVNCIYFRGTWVQQFDEYFTNQYADFYEVNGHVSKIQLMYQKENFNYAEDDYLNVQIAHLPYKSDSYDVEFVFTIILPKQGISLDEVEQKLTLQPDLMQQMLSDTYTTRKKLLLYIPKFKMETKFELNDVLIQLGMINAFSESKADFTGIVSEQYDRNGLYISKVIHKAFIDVNELGSEAAAATAVSMVYGCSLIHEEEQPIEFKADRPFLFFIRESRQNIVLFSGKFVSPPTAS
ncbi:unnamed protein product [Rotaria sp. Silwood1]|nr:unnamed protein product [Rotaria sp. Silwood1]CAF1585068.1 unnamed protein product [Rotaria sp. Silwood1]CAF3736598.1 unnamed protein product [Rotaria sp. Silwood1]CAF4858248.1 unnamed protein product [Rotaria sp. Silwood1]